MIIPGIIGRIAADGRELPEFAFADALHDLNPSSPSATSQLCSTGQAFGVVGGEILRDGTIVCAVAGNLDWLQVDLADVQSKRGPAQALLQAYRQHGTGLTSAIGGRFSLVVWDSAQRSGLIAGDRFGLMPIYWAIADNGDLLFGPTADSVTRMLDRDTGLSSQGIFHYLYFHMVPGPQTIYEGIDKLIAAHALLCRRGAWQALRYWQPDFREHADASPAEAAEEMLGLLSTSVARLAGGADTGAFLSGGLDSSTVSGLLARHRPRPKTYSIGFDAEGYDEIAYARMASERFDTEFMTYYVTPDDVLNELPRIAAAYDEPFGNSSALPAFFCARFAASDGRARLLAGDGGDELFAGNERYLKQLLFERYGRLPQWGRRHLLEPLVSGILPGKIPLVAKARSYIQQAQVPLPDRLQTYNFINQLGTGEIVSDALMDQIDSELPMRLDRELYHLPAGASRLNRMLYLDWHHTLADNDLRKVNRMCQLAGIEVEYPMLDDRLVEFSTRVSSARKVRGNRLRDFYKRAVKDLLPDEIINKSKHGFGLPFGVWMAKHPGLQELAADNLSRMRRRGYVKPEFIDRLLELHRDHHAGYYGEFIWVLLMLELWLTAHGYEP